MQITSVPDLSHPYQILYGSRRSNGRSTSNDPSVSSLSFECFQFEVLTEPRWQGGHKTNLFGEGNVNTAFQVFTSNNYCIFYCEWFKLEVFIEANSTGKHLEALTVAVHAFTSYFHQLGLVEI